MSAHDATSPQGAPQADSASAPASRQPRLFIVSFAYDWAFFLGPPLFCLALGIMLSGTALADEPRTLLGEEDTLVGFFLGATIHAHLVAVVARSHANAAIRKLHPWRFFAVPAVLYLAIVASPWVAVAATVVATWWDVWHSGAQTFGFARIYERNAGTAPTLGRRLDFALNQLLYAGPILAGATLVDHLDSFDDFDKVRGALFARELASLPSHVLERRALLTWMVVSAATLFLIVYIVAYWRFWRRGWRPSWMKVWLLASTGAVSIYTWAFNSWGQAFLIMNLFHAVQYLALVWAVEGKALAKKVGLGAHPRVAFALFLGAVGVYGLGTQVLDAGLTSLWAITIVVSLMHFWYDAFVWSVRKAQI